MIPIPETFRQGVPPGRSGRCPPPFAVPAERASKSAPTPQPGLLDRLARRFSLRLRVFAMFALVAGGTMAALAAGLAFGYARLPTGLQDDPDLRAGFMQVAILGGFLILGLVAWIWWLFDRHVAGAVEKLAATLADERRCRRTRQHRSRNGPLSGRSRPRHQRCRPPSRGMPHCALRRDHQGHAAAHPGKRPGSKPCSPMCRRRCWSAPPSTRSSSTMPPPPRFSGRKAVRVSPVRLGDFLADEPIRRAHARLSATRGPQAHADLLCTSRDGSLVLEGRMRLVEQDGEGREGKVQNGGVQDPEPGPRPDAAGGGYVLSLADVTATHAAAAEREARIARALPRLHEARRALR